MNDPSGPVRLLSGGEKFELFASADRACFVLRSKADYFEARLQGEEALRFGSDYQVVTQQFPAWKPDQTLAQLWDKGGYSWCAAQDAE
ncbi:hypothetical protein [Bradyrhizobium sp.]|uniref:hypothetical protein n=1 Tax=Bradyrhizobium sp. TaxID=376 RepID=UPI003C61A79E